MSILGKALVRVVAAVAAIGWSVGAWADQPLDTQAMIAAHHQAALEAQGKVALHEEMERNAIAGKWGGKFDMVGHCRFWQDYYRKLAEKEEQAARELQRGMAR